MLNGVVVASGGTPAATNHGKAGGVRELAFCATFALLLSGLGRCCKSNHPCKSLRAVELLDVEVLGAVIPNNVLNGKEGGEAKEEDNMGEGEVEAAIVVDIVTGGAGGGVIGE